MKPKDFLRKDIYEKGNITLVEFLPDGRIRAQNTKDGEFIFPCFQAYANYRNRDDVEVHEFEAIIENTNE